MFLGLFIGFGFTTIRSKYDISFYNLELESLIGTKTEFFLAE